MPRHEVPEPVLFRRSDGLTPHNPALWPDDTNLGTDDPVAPSWTDTSSALGGLTSGEPAHARPSEPAGVPSFLREPITGDAAIPAALRKPRHAAGPGKRRMVSSDMVLDTVPIGRVRHRRGDTGGLSAAIVHMVPDTPATGLRKFDLGTVPASVTPPRSWRKAAWFAVGTSAAVVLGLTVATAELMSGAPDDGVLIDALPAYPTGPLTLDELPHEATPTGAPHRPTSSTRTPSASASAPSDGQAEPPRDTVTGSTTDDDSTGPGTSGRPSQQTPGMTAQTTPKEPTRTTVGPQPVTLTDPEAMGDRTEQYFELVTNDPAAAHELTTGGMAREGAEGIEARYNGVERVEVQDITIDRNQAVTTSTVKVVHEDGTETIEERQLTFTWGGDPKITEDTTTA